MSGRWILARSTYGLAALAGLLCAGLTAWTALRRWRSLTVSLRGALLLAPCVLLVNLGASLYHSWTMVVQAQGRYLFPSLLCVAVMLAGTAHVEGARLRGLRAAVFTVMHAAALIGLVALAANDRYGPGAG